jgi:hypothetical protein
MVQSPDAGRIRQDYWQTVSDLWIDNFFAPLCDWLHARGLIVRRENDIAGDEPRDQQHLDQTFTWFKEIKGVTLLLSLENVGTTG